MILTNLTSRLLSWVNWIMFYLNWCHFVASRTLNYVPQPSTCENNYWNSARCLSSRKPLHPSIHFFKENVWKKHSYSESPSSNSKLAELSLPGQTARAIIVEDGEQGSLGSSWWHVFPVKGKKHKEKCNSPNLFLDMDWMVWKIERLYWSLLSSHLDSQTIPNQE